MPQPATRAATGRRWATDPGNRCERDWLRVRLADLRPGWRTDFILHRFGAEVIEREDCLVVRTPCNPTYYWGNCLHLPRLPTDAELGHWLRRFDEEIAHVQPASRHVAIGSDAPYGGESLPTWEAAGFDDVAIGIYRALGFRDLSSGAGLQRKSPQDRRA